MIQNPDSVRRALPSEDDRSYGLYAAIVVADVSRIEICIVIPSLIADKSAVVMLRLSIPVGHAIVFDGRIVHL